MWICPDCGCPMPNTRPHIQLHLTVSHSGARPIVTVP